MEMRRERAADSLMCLPGITRPFMSQRTATALFLLAAPLAACAGKTAAPDTPVPGSCFNTSEITSFEPVDRETARVIVGGSRAYELRVTGVCPDLNWADRVVLSSEGDPATAATICTGAPVKIMSPSPRGGFQECFGNEILVAPPMSRPVGR